MLAAVTKSWICLGTLSHMFFQPMECTTMMAPEPHLTQVELLIEVVTFSPIWLEESTVIKCCFLLPWYRWPPMMHILSRWRWRVKGGGWMTAGCCWGSGGGV